MTNTTTPDPAAALAAELGTIREMAAQITDDHAVADCTADLGSRCTGHDAERLADAVEKVLTRHKPGRNVITGSVCKHHENHPFFSVTAREAADVAACKSCKATVYVSCDGCGPQMPLDRCPERLDITTALMAEETASA